MKTAFIQKEDALRVDKAQTEFTAQLAWQSLVETPLVELLGGSLRSWKLDEIIEPA
jgi:hypothetical protein